MVFGYRKDNKPHELNGQNSAKAVYSISER